MKKTFLSQSENKTILFANQLANLLALGDIITLSGDLGAGKTTFTKGLANGLGIKRAVTSPTFTIMKEYEGRIPLYHIDAYRLEYAEEDIGLSEYIEGNGIAVIEWPKFIESFLPMERLAITLTYEGEYARYITIEANGERYLSILTSLDISKEYEA